LRPDRRVRLQCEVCGRHLSSLGVGHELGLEAVDAVGVGSPGEAALDDARVSRRAENTGPTSGAVATVMAKRKTG
jgi:hypothetical protein